MMVRGIIIGGRGPGGQGNAPLLPGYLISMGKLKQGKLKQGKLKQGKLKQGKLKHAPPRTFQPAFARTLYPALPW